MAQNPTRSEVVAQANNDSPLNTDPALVRGAVVGIVGAVASILVIGGYVDEGQKSALVDNVGVIVPAVLVIASVIQAVWTRLAVYSPRSAARIAIENANAPAGSPPSLAPPP